MSIICETRYNAAGELLAPSEYEIQRTGMFTGSTPTVDPGNYHRFVINAPSREVLEQHLRAFFDQSTGVGAVPGFATLRANVTKGRLQYTGDIIYVIETPAHARLQATAVAH